MDRDHLCVISEIAEITAITEITAVGRTAGVDERLEKGRHPDRITARFAG